MTNRDSLQRSKWGMQNRIGAYINTQKNRIWHEEIEIKPNEEHQMGDQSTKMGLFNDIGEKKTDWWVNHPCEKGYNSHRDRHQWFRDRK